MTRDELFFDEVHRMVFRYFDGDPEKIHDWFTTPNPLLGQVAPVDMLKYGRGEKLLQFVKERMTGEAA